LRLHILFIETILFFIEFIEPWIVQEKAVHLHCKKANKKFSIDMEQQFLINMSQDEFFEKLKECFAEALFAPEPNECVKVKKHYVYGLQGLCNLFGCSTATASRIKKSGVIDAAISQVGNTIIVDADLALDLLKVRKSRRTGIRGGYK
jgi:hypothetical protein